MHELSIAMSIVDMAEEEAERRGVTQIVAVHLKLGALSGVVEQALRSSFEVATEDTTLQGSRLLIESIPATVYCPKCCSERRLSSIQNFCCPDCGSPTPQIIHGKELEVVALEMTQ